MRFFTLSGLLITSLVFSLVISPITARSAVVPLDKIIVIVNEDVITQLELEERVKLISQQIQQQGRRLPPMDVFQKQVLERLILEKLQLENAQKTGVRVNDEMVNRVINNIARQNSLTLEQFRQVIERDGFTFSEFRENIRRQVTISQLRKIRVENKIQVSEQEIDNFLVAQTKNNAAGEEYHLAQILIATPEAASPEQISEARRKTESLVNELKTGADFSEKAIALSNDESALKGGDLGWRKSARLPDFIVNEARTMKPGDIKGPLRSSNGFHIIKLIDKRNNQPRKIINQTLARHILVRPTEILSSEEARQKIQAIYERLKLGEDFGKLAKASSDDKGSAAEGGSLNWVSPGTMVPKFEEEMNKLKPGEMSQPFLSQFGWHVVQVLSRRQHDSTEEFVRSQAIQLIRKRKTEEAIQDWLRRMRSEAYVDYRVNK